MDEKELNAHTLRSGTRVLLRYMSQYRKQIVLLSFMGVLSAIGNGLAPLIIGRFFDALSATTLVHIGMYAIPLFFALLLLFMVVQFITHILDWRITMESERFSNTIWLDYLSAGFGYLLLLPVSFHKTSKVGEVIQKINMAANALEIIAGRIVIDLSPQILSIVIAFVVAVSIAPMLAAVLATGMLVYVAIFMSSIRNTARYQTEYWNVLGFVFGDSHDVVGNTLAIKQATAEEYERKRLHDKMRTAVPLWMRLTAIWSGLTLAQRMVILITQVAIFGLSVSLIRAGSMTIGELIAFNLYTTMVFGPFTVIARNWQTIQNGMVNLHNTEEILTIPTEPYAPKDAQDISVHGDVSFEHVDFSYEHGTQVLTDVNFSVRAGDMVAFVGESGVGKSTVIDLLSGYFFPTKGVVRIDGVDTRALNLTHLRRHIAVVPQEVVLFNDTIFMNIKYGNFDASEEAVHEAARKAHAVEFIERFKEKWEQVVGERGVKLSVGQKQRVAIARAILRNPRILILDEPTAALDAGTEHEVTKALEELMRGKTTFIVAHRLSTVRAADTIVVFKEGTIVEAGTHEELLAKHGEYKRLHDLQIGLYESDGMVS